MKIQAPNTSPSGDDGHVAVPKAHTLDGCVEIASRSPGVTLGDQEPLATVEVRTRHSVYRMTVLEPRRGEILIQGGRRWPQPTEGRLLGASFGHGQFRSRPHQVGIDHLRHADGNRDRRPAYRDLPCPADRGPERPGDTWAILEGG